MWRTLKLRVQPCIGVFIALTSNLLADDSLAGDLLPSFIDSFIKAALANLKLKVTNIKLSFVVEGNYTPLSTKNLHVTTLIDFTLEIGANCIDMHSQGDLKNPFFVETTENLFIKKLLSAQGFYSRLSRFASAFTRLLDLPELSASFEGEALNHTDLKVEIKYVPSLPFLTYLISA